MPNQPPNSSDSARKDQQSQRSNNNQSKVVDAIRHVGPTLEAEGQFIPTGELPENRIENEAVAGPVEVKNIATDRYDRQAKAMGAEPLRTRLPGDTSSDPHTDTETAERRPERRKAS